MTQDLPGGELTDAALARLDVWTDGGTRDLFNFMVDAQHLVGAFAARGRDVSYLTDFTQAPGLDPDWCADAATGEALLAMAGHLPPLLVGADGTTSYLEADPGMPLGVGGAEFVQRSVRLDPGSRLVLYTDGLVEDPTSSVDEGLERLCAAASSAVNQRLDAESFSDALLGAMRPGFEHDDDIALLVFAVHDHAPATSAEELSPTDREAWLQLEPVPGSVKDARHAVARAVEVWGLPEVADVAVLLTSELVTNAIRYADGDLRLRVVRRPGGLRVEVHDRDATALPQLRVRNPDGSDDLAEGGRGLQFVAEWSTRWGVETVAGGKQVWFEVDTGT
jgi:anti-sigma regulatory factor (Ser/Thr protein kinase)